jgi:single-strand DNA-binding protein
MKTMQNSIQLIGRLGADPELVTLSSGTSLAKFRVATSEYYKDTNGEFQERTEWHPVIAWGKKAEGIAEKFRKGVKVALGGKLTHRSYEAKDGTKRYVSEIVLREITLLESRKKNSEALPF